MTATEAFALAQRILMLQRQQTKLILELFSGICGYTPEEIAAAADIADDETES